MIWMSYEVNIATNLKIRPAQVAAAIELLDGGNTIPFIARYRKEATGTLDEEQLRAVEAELSACAGWMSAAHRCWRRLKSRAS
jgi:protein Tex